MRIAAITAMTTPQSIDTTRGLDLFVHCANHIRDGYFCRCSVKQITSSRASHALYKTSLTQAPEQLLQIGKRDKLALGNRGQIHRPTILILGQINHGGHGVAALAG